MCHSKAAQQLIEEERREGEAQGALQCTPRLLSRICGSLGEATKARIQALPLEQLEGLAEALLEFSGPADLAGWLAEHKG